MTAFWAADIKRFCSLTSVKGIGRAAKAEEKHLKCLWIIGSLALILLCMGSGENSIFFFKISTGTF